MAFQHFITADFYQRTPSGFEGEGVFNELEIVYKPDYDIDTYCTQPVDQYGIGLYFIPNGGEQIATGDFNDEDFFIIGDFLPNSTSTINWVADRDDDIYYVEGFCIYDEDPTNATTTFVYDFTKDGDYFVYAADIEMYYDQTTQIYSKMFRVEQQEYQFGLMSFDDTNDLVANVSQGTATTFASILPVVAVIIGVIVAIGFTNWLVGQFNRSYNKTIERAEKAHKEYMETKK